MTDITLVHAGFDTLYIAVQGALSETALDTLKQAREAAQSTLDPQSVSIGSGSYRALVQEGGQRGGYTYRLEAGPTDIVWAVKHNTDPRNWNLFAMIGSDCLLAHGLDGARAKLWQDLRAMGANALECSINRVDFAMDFRMTGFELDTARVLAHSHSTVKAHCATDDTHFSYSSRGRKVESITIGKMPGRQVIIYDKRRQVIKKRKTYWFDAWNVNPDDRSFDIYRVELRAGKKHLKDQWQISTLEDLDNSIGDVFHMAAEKVRYLDDVQWDSNVSRQALHPLWTHVQETAIRAMEHQRSGLTEGQLKQFYRDQKIDMYKKSMIAHAAGLSVALGLNHEDATDHLPEIAGDTLSDYIRNDRDGLREKRDRLASKIRFLENDGFDREKYGAHVRA